MASGERIILVLAQPEQRRWVNGGAASSSGILVYSMAFGWTWFSISDMIQGGKWYLGNLGEITLMHTYIIILSLCLHLYACSILLFGDKKTIAPLGFPHNLHPPSAVCPQWLHKRSAGRPHPDTRHRQSSGRSNNSAHKPIAFKRQNDGSQCHASTCLPPYQAPLGDVGSARLALG